MWDHLDLAPEQAANEEQDPFNQVTKKQWDHMSFAADSRHWGVGSCSCAAFYIPANPSTATPELTRATTDAHSLPLPREPV